MDQARASQLIVGSLAASVAVSAASALADGDTPGLRLVVGAAFTGVGLATINMLGAPDLAGALSVLILTATVFVYGGPAMEAVTDLTRPDPKRTGTRRSRPDREAVPA